MLESLDVLRKIIGTLDRHLRAQRPGLTLDAAAADLDVLALEERVLYSAVPLMEPASPEAIVDGASGDIQIDDIPEQQSSAESVSTQTSQDSEPDSNAFVEHNDQVSRELVFVDSRVEDYESLLDAIASQNDSSRQFEIVFVDLSRDGIDQISDVLQGHSNLDAIHIVSHGSAGQIELGNLQLNQQSLDGYAGQIAGWAGSLATDADLLFYGCDLANEDGELLLETIAELCDCDVAASDDVTGHQDLGGDWVLEYTIGDVSTDIAFGFAAQSSWFSTLAVSPTQSVPGAQSVTENQSLVFSGANAVTVSDSDAGLDTRMQVSLTVNDGVLTLSQTNGLEIISGADGSSSLVIDGLESDLNAALNGLTFTPDADYVGAVSLDVSTAIAADLLGNYTFEGNANDQAAGTPVNNGALILGATIANDATRGGDVLNVDLGTSRVRVTGMFGNPTDLTLAAWVNLTTTDTNGADVISLGDNIALRADEVNNGVMLLFHDGTFQRSVASYVDIEGTGWRHIAATFDDANDLQTLYIDGIAVNSTSRTESVFYGSGSDTIIGRHGYNGSAYDFDGSIDDARIYDRALSAEEITALANDLTHSTTNLAITVDPGNQAPTLSVGTLTIDASEGSGALPFTLDSLTDLDSPDFDGGSLTVTVTSTPNAADDTLLIFNYNGVTVSGSNVNVGGVFVGTVTGMNSSGPLTITFNSDATPERAQSVFQAVAIQNLSQDPVEGNRTIEIVVDDGDGGVSDPVSRNVNFTAINDAPTLTAFSMFVDSSRGSNESEVTLGELAAQGDESDIDGTVDAFVVQSVSSGTLRIGTSEATSTAWSAGSNDVIDASMNAYWTPDANATGLLNAFAVVARDDLGAESSGSVVAQINVIPNDAPVITENFSGSQASEGNGVAIFAGETLTDRDSPDFDGGSLLLSVVSTPDAAGDRLFLTTANAVSSSGSDLLVGGVVIGTQSGVNTSGPFSVQFNANATLARVQALFDSLAILNDSQSPVVGARTIELVVTDGDGGTSNIASETVNFTATNDAPITTADTAQAFAGNTLYVDTASGVLANDFDYENDALTAVLVSGPGSGSLTLNADGSWNYTPAPGFLGTDTFTYTANDGSLNSSPTETVTIEVILGAVQPDPSSPDPYDPDPSDPNDPSEPSDDPLDPEDPNDPLDPLDPLDPPPDPTEPTAPDGAEPEDNGPSGGGEEDGGGGVTEEAGGPAATAPLGPLAPADSVQAMSSVEPESTLDDLALLIEEGEAYQAMQESESRHTNGRSEIHVTSFTSQSAQLFSSEELAKLNFVVDNSDLRFNVQQFHEEASLRDTEIQIVAGTANCVFIGAAAGVAVWAMGGSYLASMVLSSLPAWASFDPIHIVSNPMQTLEEDNVSVAELISQEQSSNGELR